MSRSDFSQRAASSSRSQMAHFSESEITFLIHHLFLPPKLPQADDQGVDVDNALLRLVTESLEQFGGLVPAEQQAPVRHVATSILRLAKSRDPHGAVDEEKLLQSLNSMSDEDSDVTVPLCIGAQNVGVILTKNGHGIALEAFELSPVNSAVMSTQGRLRRCFPGPALSIKMKLFKDHNLQAVLAETLSKMSFQTAIGMTPLVKKSQNEVEEIRDTKHPGLVTELVFSFLQPMIDVSDPITVQRIWKNTREEVLWQSALLPWRRSPLWLLIRVVMQLLFSRLQTSIPSGCSTYKLCMLYLLATVLQKSLSPVFQIEPDLLHCMSAKLVRRMLKMDVSGDEPGLSFVKNVLEKTRSTLAQRWSGAQHREQQNLDLGRLPCLQFKDDVSLSLPDLDNFLSRMARRAPTSDSVDFSPSPGLQRFPPDDPYSPSFNLCGVPEYTVYTLNAFEQWVASHLPTWLAGRLDGENTCASLKSLMQNYHVAAQPNYSGNPEANSIMILTLLELWIACDRSAISRFPMLRDYSPEIPLQHLQSLVLPLKEHMTRLLQVEIYLESRCAAVPLKPARSIFRDFGIENSFPVRFFNQSRKHQELLERIESRAKEDRQRKIEELAKKKGQYYDLMSQYNAISCQYVETMNGRHFYEQRHAPNCRRCNLKAQANRIQIDVHEWPLPTNKLEAKSVVFELDAPPSYCAWRDATVFLLKNVLSSNYTRYICPTSRYALHSYGALRAHFQAQGISRIGLLSETKPHVGTHRVTKSESPITSVPESDVCLNNGLQFHYFDESLGCFVSEFSPTDAVLEMCTYRLPAAASLLQPFLLRRFKGQDSTPNEVISSQFNCPQHITLAEYRCLTGIPVGHRLQWMNILAQISCPIIDFKKVETSLVVSQAIYQTGPREGEDFRRAGHAILADGSFTKALLTAVEEAARRIEENWESFQALCTLVCIVTRQLSLTPYAELTTRSLEVLSRLRQIAFSWVQLLKKKHDGTENETQRVELLEKVVEVAMICSGTFEVDDRHLEKIISEAEHASILIQCHTLIHENFSKGSTAPQTTFFLIIHRRWQRLSFRAYPILLREILQRDDATCLDYAVKESWSSYQRGSGWRTFSTQLDYWVVSTTDHRLGQAARLHYNLLTGQLLVNGLPLSRLPSQYEQHPSYEELFGRIVFQIVPSEVTGMRFSAKQDHAGHTIHFGFDDSDLLVLAKKENRTFDLIPKRVFESRLPRTFLDDYIHWFDATTETVQFCSKRQPWTSTTSTWLLTRDGPKWKISQQNRTLISPSSPTARELAKILQPLQQPLQINLILAADGRTIDIDLPRLQLGFRLGQGTSSVVSRQSRGFEIDSQQSIGTLIGLKNMLVLRNPYNTDRRVIIPAGRVSFSRDGSHVIVSIDPIPTATHVYKVDTDLRKLNDNGGLQSKLLLSYLHGLTSFCLPDPFTSRTGTEQSLSILKSAAVKSFEPLTADNLDLLQKISVLTPIREYYPPHKKVMQTVHWNSRLPVLSQHPHFHWSVAELFEQNDLKQLYYPKDHVKSPKMECPHPDLLRRDASRTSTFRISGFGAEDFVDEADVTYESRDLDQSSQRAKQSHVAAVMLFHRNPHLQSRPAPSRSLAQHVLQTLKSVNLVQGASNPELTPSSLKYDAKWLEKHPEHWAEIWCWLHQQSQTPTNQKLGRFQVMMWFATMAFAAKADMDVIYSAASMFMIPSMRAVQPPPVAFFRLKEGDAVDGSVLRSLIDPFVFEFRKCPDYHLAARSRESTKETWDRRERSYDSNRTKATRDVVEHLSRQWACSKPTQPSGNKEEFIRNYLDLEAAMAVVKPKFKTWYENYLFTLYLEQIQAVVESESVEPLNADTLHFEIPRHIPVSRKSFINTGDFFAFAPSTTLPVRPRVSAQDVLANSSSTRRSRRASPLVALIQDLGGRTNSSSYEQQYAKELRESSDILKPQPSQTGVFKLGHDDLRQKLEDHLTISTKHVETVFDEILASIRSSLGNRFFAVTFHHSPRISAVLLLQQLSLDGWDNLDGWRRLNSAWEPRIIGFGLALTEMQRARRLVRSFANPNDLIRELQNEGHRNWEPCQFPETLLLEVESDIMVRPVQEDIAKQMRRPPGMQNAVMQLNMGEGKSSVIAPMVTAALADGSRLVRVIVAKPQSRQMLYMLVSKLGGLLNRRVFLLPFSRALQLSVKHAQSIHDECVRCLETRGVMLVQPEHILSFKLMGLESLITGKEEISRSLLKTQHFFDTRSRDIVDESDENFSVKFELIYTMGVQGPVEFAPERWIVIQTVLDFVRCHAGKVRDTLPLSIQVDERYPGGFPCIRLLKSDATVMLLGLVAEDICTRGFAAFPVSRQGLASRQAILRYITQPELSLADVENVEESVFWTEATQGYLLLLRGLFAGGILSFAFGQKRWRVNYGLDNTRQPPTQLAVPYRAKDSPTPRSEFSHPDVIIILTCNCYYLQGLSDDDLFLAFNHLVDSDQADAEYRAWVDGSDKLPYAFRQLVGVNLKDTVQCKAEVFPPFRYAKRTIDYFLQSIVFHKQMKEFPQKLSASGWDIGAVKTHPTTGFSGTIDSRKVLPLDVDYLDLPEQKHTNALVLEYLLRPENSVMLLPSGTGREPDSTSGSDSPPSSIAETLLSRVVGQTDSKLRVILDVGAQILELTNVQLAKKWLGMARTQDSSVEAAIYFDDSEEVMVLDHNGYTEPLRASPYDDQLDVCLVFLDEAHTRGIDLRLPEDYRAAVTLGANLTKDRLVQACMRMRKLGKGQSVVFCVPQEIQTKICDREAQTNPHLQQHKQGHQIGVLEVLSWAIGETHNDLRRSMPLWAVQGKRFERQRALWDRARTTDGIDMTAAQSEEFLEEEAQTLEQRYQPKTEGAAQGTIDDCEVDNEHLHKIRDRCREVGSLNYNEATLQEEQERELSHEKEEERQLERPPPADPAVHRICKDLRAFVLSGKLSTGSAAFKPAFEALRETSAAEHVDVSLFPKDILVTADFERTIQKSNTGRFRSDAYQRPVQWILTSQPASWQYVVIISPYEAQELLPETQKNGKTTLHIYSARPNLEIRPLDGLDLYTVPSSSMERMRSPIPLRLVVQLNLFAGQLYFKSFEEYVELCNMLRLSWEEAREGTVIAADGFIISSSSEAGSAIIQGSTFTNSPVKFLKDFLTVVRRDCQPIGKTHLGKILDGALLREDEFDRVI